MTKSKLQQKAKNKQHQTTNFTKNKQQQMLIILSFIANIDSFFISCLTAGKKRSNLVLLTFSPCIHTIFCFLGILLQHQMLFTTDNRLLLYLLIAILLTAGLYLLWVYNPKKEQPHKSEDTLSIRPTVLMILLLFCSFDAIVAGIVFAYWKIKTPGSLVFVFIINLFMILTPIIFKSLSNKKLNETVKATHK